MSEHESQNVTELDGGSGLTIYEVGALYQLMTEQLQNDHPLRLDLSKVDVIDSAGIQLLVNFLHSCKARQKPLRVKGVSNELAQALTSLGLLHVFLSED